MNKVPSHGHPTALQASITTFSIALALHTLVLAPHILVLVFLSPSSSYLSFVLMP